MSNTPSKILYALASKNLKWHTTDQPGYFICEEESGKRTYLTPSDLYRIDPRLPQSLQWYAARHSAQQTGDLMQKTMRYWLAAFHLPWSAPGLKSSFCLLSEVIAIEHYSPSTRFFKLRGLGVGLRHCQTHKIAVEYTTASVSYSVDTLKLHVPRFEQRLASVTTLPLGQWRDHLFGINASPVTETTLDDDVAAAYDGLLF